MLLDTTKKGTTLLINWCCLWCHRLQVPYNTWTYSSKWTPQSLKQPHLRILGVVHGRGERVRQA